MWNCFVLLDDISSHANSTVNFNKLCDSGLRKSIYRCKLKICKLMPNFVLMNKVISTSSKKIFDCRVPNGTTYIDCNSPNVIYLVTCSRCSFHHVVETA